MNIYVCISHCMKMNFNMASLQWRHNEHDGASNHRRLDCLPNRLFRRRSKKTSKFRVTGLCGGNPPVTGGFPSQRFSNASWWRRHDYQYSTLQMSRQARQTTFPRIMLCWSEHHFHEVYLSLYGLIIDCRTRHISEMNLGLHPANERRRY